MACCRKKIGPICFSIIREVSCEDEQYSTRNSRSRPENVDLALGTSFNTAGIVEETRELDLLLVFATFPTWEKLESRDPKLKPGFRT